MRQVIGTLLGLVVSAGVSYAMVVYVIALGFDGPGSLSTTEAVAWIAVALGTILGGFGLGYLIISRIVRTRLTVILGMAPGFAISAYLFSLTVHEALSLVRP